MIDINDNLDVLRRLWSGHNARGSLIQIRRIYTAYLGTLRRVACAKAYP